MSTTTIFPSLDHPSKLTSSSCKPAYIVFYILAILIFPATLHSSAESHICSRADDPDSCLTLVRPLTVGSAGEVGILNELNNSLSRIGDAMRLTKSASYGVNDLSQKSGLADCVDLMDSSMDRIVDSISVLSKKQLNVGSLDDAKTWLSGVLTNHVTCMDGLDLRPSLTSKLQLESYLQDLIDIACKFLAILNSVTVSDEPQDHDMIGTPSNGNMPSWITPRDQKLLHASGVNADVVVAKDGSGNYSTVQEAVEAAPVKSKTRYVIYVRDGTYMENVKVPKNKTNLMLVGDGMDSTIITSNLSKSDRLKTFNTGTLIVEGDGFIGQDLWIQNTAGPEKDQAVALRVSADHSVINRCRLDAYQDTLYAHKHRQFYRDCTITGTVDFIFGNAAAVFQKCKIMPRKPDKDQKNMVTAQSRTCPFQTTGFSFQYCNITAAPDLEQVNGTVYSYLGRPWKEYSRTVVMESYIGDVIHPAGWFPWDEDFALDTLYYGEYLNWGPGAGTSNRVTWHGYRNITDTFEAHQFTVKCLIHGPAWLNSTGVAYTEGLETLDQTKNFCIDRVLI